MTKDSLIPLLQMQLREQLATFGLGQKVTLRWDEAPCEIPCGGKQYRILGTECGAALPTIRVVLDAGTDIHSSLRVIETIRPIVDSLLSDVLPAHIHWRLLCVYNREGAAREVEPARLRSMRLAGSVITSG